MSCSTSTPSRWDSKQWVLHCKPRLCCRGFIQLSHSSFGYRVNQILDPLIAAKAQREISIGQTESSYCIYWTVPLLAQLRLFTIDWCHFFLRVPPRIFLWSECGSVARLWLKIRIEGEFQGDYISSGCLELRAEWEYFTVEEPQGERQKERERDGRQGSIAGSCTENKSWPLRTQSWAVGWGIKWLLNLQRQTATRHLVYPKWPPILYTV